MPSGKEDYERLYGGPPAVSQGQADYERLYRTPDAPLPPSDLTIDIEKPSPDTPAAAEGPFARYTGQPDLPLEDAQSPVDLIADFYTLGGGVGLAREGLRRLAPTAGRLATRAVEGLALEGTHKVQQAVGNTPGQVTDFGWPDVVNLVLPGVLDAPAAGRTALGYTRAGRSVQVAKEATAAQEATYAQDVAADRGRLMPDGSLPPVRPVPPAVQPTPIVMPDRWHMLSELGLGSAFTPYLGALGGAKVTGGLYLADSLEALVSKGLMLPKVRPWLQRQLEANGGQLSPQTLATLSTVVRGGMPAEAR